MKKKDGLVIFLIIFLSCILIFIAFGVINELKKDDIIGTNEINGKGSYDTLVQEFTCSGTKTLLDGDGNNVGTEVTTYSFVFTGETFNTYKKEILYSFDTSEGYQNYCLNCDNTEAASIMNLTNGINVSVNTSINKYIYEVIEIDVAKYDGPFRESKYGLDGLDTKSTVGDAIFLTRDMICYWK